MTAEDRRFELDDMATEDRERDLARRHGTIERSLPIITCNEPQDPSKPHEVYLEDVHGIAIYLGSLPNEDAYLRFCVALESVMQKLTP